MKESRCYQALKKIEFKDIVRFFRKVEVRGPAECWYWTGFKNEDGYGKFGLNGQAQGAHRVSYTIAHGLPNPKLELRHTCNVEHCVNPNHLIEGTHQENMDDRTATGWKPSVTVRGEEVGSAKLTNEQVARIREMGSAGMTHDQIAVSFPVSAATVGRVIQRKIWKHI